MQVLSYLQGILYVGMYASGGYEHIHKTNNQEYKEALPNAEDSETLE